MLAQVERMLSDIVPTFSVNNVSACCHTGVLFLSFSDNRLGSKAALNASLDSRGSRLGRWSIEMTDNGGLSYPTTGRVGWENVDVSV